MTRPRHVNRRLPFWKWTIRATVYMLIYPFMLPYAVWMKLTGKWNRVFQAIPR